MNRTSTLRSVQGTFEPFGTALRRLRERSGLSQEELAARACLSVHAISALERGERRRPYPHTMRALASALGLDGEDRAALEAGLAPGGRRHQPPGSPSPLIDREDEIRSVADLVLGGPRLVTLTGPGGVGKTRLALAVGERLGELFTDGVAFISLASICRRGLGAGRDCARPGVACNGCPASP